MVRSSIQPGLRRPAAHRPGLGSAAAALVLPLWLLAAPAAHGGQGGWVIDTQTQWQDAALGAGQFTLTGGLAAPTQAVATFESRIQTFGVRQRFTAMTFTQSDDWGNWTNVPQLGPVDDPDAPVFISPADNDYWYLNADAGTGKYNSWHSTDMVHWTKYSGATNKSWVTSAEYANGKFYVYYDNPNDADPHLMIFDGLISSSNRQDVGRVLDSPVAGSDMAIFRDTDGSFHLIHEDWSAINARQHSWDSQYAGHTSSPDGINGFSYQEHPAPIDLRGNPTGQIGTYTHPYIPGTLTYDVHDGSLDSFGDYSMIKVGDTYYLFCDYHPEGGTIGLGYWKSKSLDQAFTWGGVLRSGFHPDPDVGFAEGRFVMFVQDFEDQQGGGLDLVSDGPWVDALEAQVGVDTDGDGDIDFWTAWQRVTETYARRAGFAKVLDLLPASLDLSAVPEGYGVQFRFRTGDMGAILDRIVLESQSAPEPGTLGVLALGSTLLLGRRRGGGSDAHA